MERNDSAFCPRFHHAIELIGRRWTGAILRAMFSGRTRFSDLAAAVPGLSDRLLSERLKELEAEGLIARCVYPDTPVRIEYQLTEKGRALQQTIEAVATWADQWVNPTLSPAPAQGRTKVTSISKGKSRQLSAGRPPEPSPRQTLNA